MMSAALPPDDVSVETEMMLLSIVRNDAMFAIYVPKARIISEAASCAKHASFCPIGQTSFQKPSFVLLKIIF